MSSEKPAGIERELQIVSNAKKQLLALNNVHHVSLGVTHDDKGENLRPAIWVHTIGDVPDLDRLAKNFELPIETIPLSQPDETAQEQLAQPAPGVPEYLKQRGNPPVGGYQIGPNQTLKGSVGLFGYVPGEKGSNPKDNLAMVTAAHVFAFQGGYYEIARQPATALQKDIISTGSPLTKLTAQDIIVYKIDKKSRDWEYKTTVAILGAVPTTEDARKGMSVTKVGYQTGRTSGKIVDILGNYFSIKPDNPSAPISENGDSGAAWVTPKSKSSDWNWVGIHRGRLNNQNIALAVMWGPIVRELKFQTFSGV
jgi:hypothetical protein